MRQNIEFKYEKTTAALLAAAPWKPEIGIVLGSGLGDFTLSVNTVKSISTKDLPDYPKSTVKGHEGFIHFAEYEDKKMLLFQGRIHFYEGYTLSEVLAPVFLANSLGVKDLLLTNAAGGINAAFLPGDLMLCTDFITFQIMPELAKFLGIASEKEKNFMLDFPSSRINDVIRKSALEENINLKEGSYWFSKGPSYETPAEIRMMSKFKTDSVGMSTAHEAIYARVLGMNVSAISLITNFAAGISDQKLSHQEVIETGLMAKEKFGRLVKTIISSI